MNHTEGAIAFGMVVGGVIGVFSGGLLVAAFVLAWKALS
jgi:hypothetical protein